MHLDRCEAKAYYAIVTRNYTFKHVNLIVAPGYVCLYGKVVFIFY